MSALRLATARAMPRRRFLQITAACGGLVLTGGLTAASHAAGVVVQRAARILMGTQIHLTVIMPDAGAAQTAVDATFAEMARLAAILDHRQPTAALARLNAAGQLDDAPAELTAVLQAAIAYGKLTGGAFDVTVLPLLAGYQRGASDVTVQRALVDYRQIVPAGSRIALGIAGAGVTLDGIAKGRIIDAAVATLAAHGADRVFVEAGGDLRTLGVRVDDKPWRVGVAHPRRPGELLGELSVDGRAVATSGDYMNHFTDDFASHHILDPHTGRSPNELASVTVLAPTAMDADALATALMVLGVHAGLALAAQLPGVDAVMVTKALQIFQTRGVRIG